MKSFMGTDAWTERHWSSISIAFSPRTARRSRALPRATPIRSATGTTCCRKSPSRIWQALPRFRGECSERTFLFRIAHNRGIAYLARSRSQMPGLAEEMEVHDPAPDPESGLAQEQSAARLRRAIHRLPVAYRQVVTLTLEGLGYGEIAEVLGISESNVGVRLTRARQILRESLENRR